jgi:hypothetical protein
MALAAVGSAQERIMDASMKDRPANPGEEQRLSRSRNALLDLHKTLVDSERIAYEKTVGAIQSPNHFLQLLTGDPWFAWLHPISELIVSMDEALDGKAPLTGAMVAAMIEQAGQLLVASEVGEGFSRHYFDALQENPDVVFAHAEVMKALGRPRPSSGPSSN